jgi:hypothetical protein
LKAARTDVMLLHNTRIASQDVVILACHVDLGKLLLKALRHVLYWYHIRVLLSASSSMYVVHMGLFRLFLLPVLPHLCPNSFSATPLFSCPLCLLSLAVAYSLLCCLFLIF